MKNSENPVKRPLKDRKIRFVQTGPKKTGFCDFATTLSVPAVCDYCWSYGAKFRIFLRYEFLRPLVI